MHEFFTQLDTFSQRFFRELGIEEKHTPWGPRNYTGGYPRGAVIHYTADGDIERVTKWFMEERFNAQASANVIVADRRYPSLNPMLEDLPLIKDLPVTVVQCQSPNKPTWHATWASHETYGIEALNVGELRTLPGDRFVSHWRRNHDPDEPEWSMLWEHPLKEALPGWYRYWEPYTVEQIVTIINILRHLRAMYSELEPGWVIGHECVQGEHTPGSHNDKRDPGPLFPMRQVRKCVFDGESAASTADWVKAYGVTDGFCDRERDVLTRGWAALEAEMLPELPTAEVAWLRFQVRAHALVSDSAVKFAPTGTLALALLGYHIPVIRNEMHDADKVAVRMFQKMAGLKPDRIPGPATRAALIARLYDRGVLLDGQAH